MNLTPIATSEELQVFNFNGLQLRAKLIGGEPMFVLRDAAEVLNITRGARITERLREKGVRKTYIPTAGGNQEMTVIDEGNLYRVIMRSNSPAAELFETWIADEVLPTIRKTGSYETPKTLEQRSLELLGELTDRVRQQQAELESARPKVELHDQIMTAEGHLSVSDAGKLLAQAGVNTGPRKLFADLDALGWTFVRGGKRQIYENIRRQKLLDYKAQSYFDQNRGERVIAEPQIRVTPKGLEKLRIKLLPPLSEELAA